MRSIGGAKPAGQPGSKNELTVFELLNLATPRTPILRRTRATRRQSGSGNRKSENHRPRRPQIHSSRSSSSPDTTNKEIRTQQNQNRRRTSGDPGRSGHEKNGDGRRGRGTTQSDGRSRVPRILHRGDQSTFVL
jgi:hypothetical protein